MCKSNGRKLFVFNMSSQGKMYFLNRSGEICEDFSPACVFFDSVIAMQKIKKIESIHKDLKLQIELLPRNIADKVYKNDVFWSVFSQSRNLGANKREEQGNTLYNKKSVPIEALADMVNGFWD